MPTVYAHWRFGNAVLPMLPEALAGIVAEHRVIYDVGTQGPDVFFHYNCLKSNEVNRYGSELHRTPMKDILRLFKKGYDRAPDRAAAMAYCLGFLAHFTLDSYCHGYIELKAKREGPSHDKIEAQYDRHCLLKDGQNPYKTNPAASLKPDAGTARVMAGLYGHFDESIMLKSVRDQVFYRRLLWDNFSLKRFVLSTAMKAVGAGKYCDMMMGKDQLPLCVTSNMRVDKYFDQAAAHYGVLAENMAGFLTKDAPLCPYFDHDFGPKEDWLSIPLLPEEQEKDYRAARQP